MKIKPDYEEPKLMELDALFLHGDDTEYDGSEVKFGASYDEGEEEGEEHETVEL